MAGMFFMAGAFYKRSKISKKQRYIRDFLLLAVSVISHSAVSRRQKQATTKCFKRITYFPANPFFEKLDH